MPHRTVICVVPITRGVAHLRFCDIDILCGGDTRATDPARFATPVLQAANCAHTARHARQDVKHYAIWNAAAASTPTCTARSFYFTAGGDIFAALLRDDRRVVSDACRLYAHNPLPSHTVSHFGDERAHTHTTPVTTILPRWLLPPPLRGFLLLAITHFCLPTLCTGPSHHVVSAFVR